MCRPKPAGPVPGNLVQITFNGSPVPFHVKGMGRTKVATEIVGVPGLGQKGFAALRPWPGQYPVIEPGRLGKAQFGIGLIGAYQKPFGLRSGFGVVGKFVGKVGVVLPVGEQNCGFGLGHRECALGMCPKG